MKHALQKITIITVICLFTTLIGCQKDDSETEQQSFTQKTDDEEKILTPDEVKHAIEIFGEQMNKVQSPVDFSLDIINLSLIPDHYGKDQYTYMIKHNDDDERTFHNVIITDWDGKLKTMLVKYEMSEDFALSFYEGRADLNQFNGTITYTLLTADDGYPCGETPGGGIPITGGEGPGDGGSSGPGGGTGSGGQPWNPNGNGNPFNQAVVNNRYLWMTLSYLESQFNPEPIRYIFDRPVNTKNLIPPNDDTTNPCGDGDVFPVLFPFDILIDPLFYANFECQANVVMDTYGVCSNLNAAFLDIFESNDTYNVIYKNTSTYPIHTNARTGVASLINNPDGTKKYTYSITFRDGFLNTATDMAIAQVTIHENIHAILLYLRAQGKIENITTTNPTYQELLDAYSEKMHELGLLIVPPFGDIHHQFMAKFIDDIAATLKAYGISKGYNKPDQFYNDLAWTGLIDLAVPGGYVINPAFTALVPNSNDQTRIRNRIAAESNNLEWEGTIPSLSPQSCNQ